MQKILSCRTPALGGQLFQCPDCPGFAYRFHSCNDRHCPLCGQTDAAAWLERQQARLLLPVPYFLLTFTVPEELRRFIRSHHVRTLFNQRLRKQHPELWAQVPPAVWKTPWNVGAQAAGSGQDALRYLSRYIFKTATSNRPVQLLPEGKLLWTYRESKTRQFSSLRADPPTSAASRLCTSLHPALSPLSARHETHRFLARRTGPAPTPPTTMTRPLRIIRLPQKRDLRCEQDRSASAQDAASSPELKGDRRSGASWLNHSTRLGPGLGKPAYSPWNCGKRCRAPILSAKSRSSLNIL